MALEGTLRDFSFADILQLISLQRKTGVLTLKNEANVVTISFLDGCLVGASSLNQHTEDRIGLILLKKGEVTRSELEAALRRQEETLQRLGRILIDHHLVSKEVVREALEQQILQIVFRVFRWSDGDYHFSQETDVDYDRDLMRPMAADSIIMEGARMTDEWPFIDQRIQDRDAVYVMVDPDRHLEVREEGEGDDFDDLSFGFSESPDRPAPADIGDDRVSPRQMTVYRIVDGRRSVEELILESPLIEFETCKAIADLLDRGFIRPATQEEVVRGLREDLGTDDRRRIDLRSIPWLALPFLVLLGFSLTVIPRNPANPTFSLPDQVWDTYVLESASWFRMQRLAEAAERMYFVRGGYPESIDDLEALPDVSVRDPWGRTYRLVTRGHRLIVTGSDRAGRPVPQLILGRHLAWEGEPGVAAREGRPGVRLLP